jgi:hypothetical protein
VQRAHVCARQVLLAERAAEHHDVLLADRTAHEARPVERRVDRGDDVGVEAVAAHRPHRAAHLVEQEEQRAVHPDELAHRLAQAAVVLRARGGVEVLVVDLTEQADDQIDDVDGSGLGGGHG